MKTISITIIFALFGSAVMNAQDALPLIVTEDSLTMANTIVPGISVVIPEVEADNTIKNWIKVLESGTRSKVISEDGEMSVFGANIKDISENPVNIYSTLSETENGVYLNAAFELKKDVFIESVTGASELSKAKSFMLEFGKEQYIELTEEQLKAEENKLRDLEKEVRSLERDQSGMERTIVKSNRTIANERERLISLNNELTSITASIADEQIQLTTLEDESLRKEKEDYLKSLEKTNKKTTRAIRKSKKRLSKAERAIEKASNAIPRNDRIQSKYKDEIDAQSAVVQSYLDKLNTIKGYQ